MRVIHVTNSIDKSVGGSAAFYIDKKPNDSILLKKWKKESADILEKVISLNTIQRKEMIEKSLNESQKFTAEYSLNAIEVVYKEINQI